MMINLVRTDADNSHFIRLVELLDAELAIRDGEDHAFYHQFNSLDGIKHVVLVFDDDLAVGCGALKTFNHDTMEVKRMFTRPEHRGKNVAGMVLKELEKWAAELGHKNLVLKTGFNQPEAIRLYQKNLFKVIDNYGQYVGVKNSICFGKILV